MDEDILGRDCDENAIYEFCILHAIWANDVDIEDLEDADPREYCAVVAEDGKAYAISIDDHNHTKLIREREHIPEGYEIPTLIKPINAMQRYELSSRGMYDGDYEELREKLNMMLKKQPLTKSVQDINDDILKLRKSGQSVKKVSDGYHTFEDYTDDRNLYFMALCEAYFDISWKSRKHFDEENDPMFNGDFIAGINTPTGVITQHIKMKYWDELNITEIGHAPKYDGYTEEDVKERIKSLSKLKKQ